MDAQIRPRVLRQIEKFLELAFCFAPPARRSLYGRKGYYYSMRKRSRYIRVYAGCFCFRVEPMSGAIRTWSSRNLYSGYIGDFMRQRDWERKKIKWVGSIPHHIEIVCVCGRLYNVRQTVLGPRCRYCRSVDSRHISAIRALGGVPMVDGQAMKNYLTD